MNRRWCQDFTPNFNSFRKRDPLFFLIPMFQAHMKWWQKLIKLIQDCISPEAISSTQQEAPGLIYWPTNLQWWTL